MSGTNHPINGEQRYLLFPLALFYWGVIFWRNLFYRIGFFVSRKLPCTVISVGNITTGGTGKTPMVITLAKLLQEHGKAVAVLSRGYGRRSAGTVLVTDGRCPPQDWQTVGDEPRLMAAKLTGVPIVVDENRYRGGTFLVQKFKPDIIILDDAFQHRAIVRDVDIVLINSGDRKRDLKLLPYGMLREPWIHLRRASIVFLTKINLHKTESFLLSRLNRLPVPWFPCRIKIGPRLIGLNNREPRTGDLKGKRILAVSAIGDPKGFERALKRFGPEIVKTIVFPDHHRYTREDVRKIERERKRSHADWIITTEKDLIKLENSGAPELPLYALPIEVDLTPEGEQAILKLILGSQT
ncbi:MAG: tetraacyldisaccharide 4'-kinase [FCB group bacterium]|nr:tetraacyldisaccharide 4'-kinase [FCB group bacterium]